MECLASKIAKIELNSFLLRKLREKIAADKSEKVPSLVQVLCLLKEKFDIIVGHISDFSFVADTVMRVEHFKLYT
jgi:hypothetical protein